jgi:diacylglycerol kinase (ATP)
MTSERQDMSLKHMAEGISWAWNGVVLLVRTQRTARIHLFFTFLICGLAAVLRLPADEWKWLILAMAMVWTAEAVNTAIELLSDIVCPAYHTGIKKTKDVAAAAVFLAVIGAIAIGVLVLVPPLWNLVFGGSGSRP